MVELFQNFQLGEDILLVCHVVFLDYLHGTLFASLSASNLVDRAKTALTEFPDHRVVGTGFLVLYPNEFIEVDNMLLLLLLWLFFSLRLFFFCDGFFPECLLCDLAYS